jgi:6-phosphogluconolactonase
MPPTLSRRSVLLGSGAGLIGAAAGSPRPRFAYVGSRTKRAGNARGAGITVWRTADPARPWELVQSVPADDGDGTSTAARGQIPMNPHFLALSADKRRLYAVHGDATQVSAFTADPGTGLLTLLNTVDTGRRNPAHLAVDPTGRWLVVAHVTPPGSVTSLPIAGTGRLGPVTGVLQLPGTPGPHKTQQLGANPHQVVFDPAGRWIVIPDRGLDRIFTAVLDAATGALELNRPGWTPTRELEGPRHVAFHPKRPLAYVVNELRSTVTTYHWDPAAGTLRPLQVLASTPPTLTTDSRAAEIAVAPSGGYVYVSNRGEPGSGPDTIGVFGVEPRAGTLLPGRWVPTEGSTPRFFCLDPAGRHLFVANEGTGTIAGFSVDPAGGGLTAGAVLARTGSPACIVFR